MLQTSEKHTPESFKAIQTDFYSEHAAFYLPKLIELLKNKSLSTAEVKGVEYLKSWNMNMDAQQVAPAIYEKFFIQLLQNLFADDLGESLYKEFISDKVLVRNAIHRVWINQKSQFVDNIKTPEIQESLEDIILTSYQEAIGDLTSKYGEEIGKWKWGKIHHTIIKHPLGTVTILDKLLNLNRGPYGIGGSFHTVEPFAYKYGNPFESNHGASQRHVYVTGNWDESWTIIPTGISGIPASPYYCDQTELYMKKQYRRDWFSKPEVIKHAKYKLLLTP